MSVFLHQINFQHKKKGNVQFKKIPKAITVLASYLLIYSYVQDILFVITSEDLMIDLQCQLIPLAMQLNCLIFNIYIHRGRRPFPSPIYG